MKKSLTKKLSLSAVTLMMGLNLAVPTAQVLAEEHTLEDLGLETQTEFPIVDEEIEMTMMGPGAGLAEWGDMPMLQDYSEKTGIKWTYRNPPMDDFGTNLNLAFASGDLTDVILGAGANLNMGMEIDYGDQGILLPLEDLIEEHAPNLKQVLEDNPDIKKSITTPDGHIYSLPFISQGVTGIWPTGPLWYNGSFLEALGVEEVPETVDELYDLLVRMRDEDPNGNGEQDEIPFSDVALEHCRPYLLAAFGMKANGIEEVDGEVRFAPVTDNYRGYLEFMNKLYEEDLMDKETFSQTNDQKKAKGQDNRIGLFQDWYSYFTLGGSEEDAMKNPMFKPLTSEWTDEPIAIANPQISTGNFVITSQCENPEAAIAWVDYFYSPQGSFYFNKGPAGYLWDYAEDDEGKVVAVLNHDKVEEYDSSEDYRGRITPNYGLTVPALEMTGLPRVKHEANEPDISDFEQFLIDENAEKIDPYAQVPYPVTYLTNEEQDSIAANATDITTFVEEMEAKFITGKEELTDEAWEKYVQTLEGMNLEDYVKVYQDAYDRWADA